MRAQRDFDVIFRYSLTLAFPPRATSLVPTIPKLGFLAILSDILRKWDKIKTQLFWQSLGASNFYHYIWWKILKSETASPYWPKQKHRFSEILKIFRLNWTLWVTQLRYNHETLRKKMPWQTLIISEIIMWVIWNRRSLLGNFWKSILSKLHVKMTLKS